jgi:hypothetical protein
MEYLYRRSSALATARHLNELVRASRKPAARVSFLYPVSAPSGALAFSPGHPSEHRSLGRRSSAPAGIAGSLARTGVRRRAARRDDRNRPPARLRRASALAT